MQGWQHSHNLRQTTSDRLNGVIDELKAAQTKLRSEGSDAHALSADERLELQRIDRALPLLQEAVRSLAG
jgi:hypothetical protein